VGRGKGGRGGMRMTKMRRRGGGVERWVRSGRGASGPCSLGLRCMLSQWSLRALASVRGTDRSRERVRALE
jgi:hypothetical protein